MEAAAAAYRGGRVSEAEALYRRALGLEPGHVGALVQLGSLQVQTGRARAGIPLLRRALALSPDLVAAYTGLGAAHRSLGEFAEAERCHREALRRAPGNAGLSNNLGVALQDLGRPDEAEKAYREAAASAPGFADPHFNLAVLLREQGRVNEAVASLKRTIALRPDHLAAHVFLTEMLVEQGDAPEAVGIARRAAALPGMDPELLRRLGIQFRVMGQWDAAIQCFDRALALLPDDPETRVEKADVLGRRGDEEQAYALLAPLLEGDRPNPRAAALFARHSRRLGRGDEALERVERALTEPDLAEAARVDLCFAAGRLHDGAGDFDRAFARYAEGNRLQGVRLDRDEVRREVDRLIAAFAPGRMERLQRATVRSELPVFIVGMPRSGTTLVEQILSSHPRVFGAGELLDLARIEDSLPRVLKAGGGYPDCVEALTPDVADALARWYLDRLASRGPDADRVTDKLPQNFTRLGLITLLFPQARVIHCVRDPVDTCLSCYFQHFSTRLSFTFDLGDVGFYYREYRRLMRHWAQVKTVPVLEVRYEDLVARQEEVSRGMVAFLGLEWDDACLRFHKSRRAVLTASRDQVNRPVYKSSAGRWRNYERHLGPLLEALGPEAG